MAQRTERLYLRDLSPATRLVIAAFMIAVGIGYFSALVQLHLQHAGPGSILPSLQDARNAYGMHVSAGQVERLITASEDRAFNGHGTMSPAFTTESAGWLAFVREHGEQEARKLRDAERLVMLDWIKSGADKNAYDEDSYKPSDKLPASVALPKDYLVRDTGVSTLERLITAPADHPFNIEGSMRSAFFTRSPGWDGRMAARGQDVVKEAEGEAKGLLDWIRGGMKKEAYDEDKHPLTGELASLKITPNFVGEDNGKRFLKVETLLKLRCVRCHKPGNSAAQAPLGSYEDLLVYSLPEPGRGEPVTPEHVQIRTLIKDRCVRCHQDAFGADDRARKAPLDTYERFQAYCDPEKSGGISLRALAQTTHAHLLSFAVLFSLTGLVFSFTSWPMWVRLLIGPLALVAQVAEIGCWWLSRVYPEASLGIVLGGGIVGAALGFQILGTLVHMVFGRKSESV